MSVLAGVAWDYYDGNQDQVPKVKSFSGIYRFYFKCDISKWLLQYNSDATNVPNAEVSFQYSIQVPYWGEGYGCPFCQGK